MSSTRKKLKLDQKDCQAQLVFAARNGHIIRLEELLKSGATVNTREEFADSALNSALINGHIECAEKLLKYGAQINVHIALQSAMESEGLTYFTYLLDHHSEETKLILMENKEILLQGAVKAGNLGVIRHIGAAGCDSLLHHTISEHFDSDSRREMVTCLLNNGANPNALCETNNHTPLAHAASTVNDCKLLQILIQNGADICLGDKHGNTALMLAIKSRQHTNTEFVIKNSGHNFLNSQNKEGLTALMMAINMKQVLELVGKLITKKVNIADINGNTALMHAINCGSGNNELAMNYVTLLISAGSDINCQNMSGQSPLMMAAENHRSKIIKELLEKGADVNAVSSFNNMKTAISSCSVKPFA